MLRYKLHLVKLNRLKNAGYDRESIGPPKRLSPSETNDNSNQYF